MIQKIDRPQAYHLSASFQQMAQQLSAFMTFEPIKHSQNQIQVQTILKEIVSEMQHHYEDKINLFEQKTKEEYLNAKIELQNQAKRLKKQKASPLQKQIGKLKRRNIELQSEKYKELHNQYLSKNFESFILGSSRISQLQQLVANEIRQQCLFEFQQEKQRRKRQILVKAENKNKKQRERLNIEIKNRIQTEKGLAQQNKSLKEMKIILASKKSKLNLIFYDLNEQIKRIANQIKDTEFLLMNESIEELKSQLYNLRKQKITKENIKEGQNKNKLSDLKEEDSFEEDSLEINIVYPRSNREMSIQRKMINLSTQEDSKNVFCPQECLQEQLVICEKAYENMRIHDCFENSSQENQSNKKQRKENFKEIKNIRSILRFYQTSQLNNHENSMRNSIHFEKETSLRKQKSTNSYKIAASLAPQKAKHLSINTRRAIIKNLTLLSDNL